MTENGHSENDPASIREQIAEHVQSLSRLVDLASPVSLLLQEVAALLETVAELAAAECVAHPLGNERPACSPVWPILLSQSRPTITSSRLRVLPSAAVALVSRQPHRRLNGRPTTTIALAGR